MKKNIKKILVIAVMSMALVACGTPKTDGETSSNGTEQGDENPEEPEKQGDDSELPEMPAVDWTTFDMEESELPQLSGEFGNNPVATIKTNYGDIKVVLFPNEAPKAVENFLTHSKDGYYDGVVFHRVMEEFMIQGGDPTGTGSGGESIWGEDFESEISQKLYHVRGALSMAKTLEPVSNSSQFFIVQNTDLTMFLGDIAEVFEVIINDGENARDYRSALTQMLGKEDGYPKLILEEYLKSGGTMHLDGQHTVFGHVLEGMDVVDTIAKVEKEPDTTGQGESVPVEPVVIETIIVEE